MRAFLADAVESKKVAGGSLLILQHGKQVFGEGFGYADVASKRTFQLSTPVVIASISKPLLGTALCRLVDQNKLKMDQPISDLLPEFSDCQLESGASITRAPTTTELLTHISGLRYDRAKSGRIWFQDWTSGQTLEYVVKKVAKEFAFKYEPGTKYAYSGIGTDVAARVGEVASGLSRNELLQKELAQPLGMQNTFYSNVKDVRQRQFNMPPRYYTNKKTGQYQSSRKRSPPAEGTYSSSGGSVISTAPDLAIWLTMIRNQGRLANGDEYLSASTFEKMLEKQKGSYNAKGGLFVRRRDKDGKPVKYAHTGSTGTYVWIDFEYDLICICLTQTAGSSEFQKDLESLIRKCLAASVQ
ncbi:MAG: serine hydrolase domain-containing protein [Planctomycetota bacterium]